MTYIRPFWFDEALKHEGEPAVQPLQGDTTADVCIVGGGYTGLWTALELKARRPGLDIVVLEQKQCGYGASGSNGGCVLTLSTKFLSLSKFYGEAEARRLVRASEDAVGHLQSFTRENGIECGLRCDGTLYIASNEAQVGTMKPVMQALDRAGINAWTRLPDAKAREFAGTARIHEAFFSPHAGSVQPALLVRGLARVARAKGIRIYEGSPMRNLEEGSPPRVQTPGGSVTAGKVILAINAWMGTAFPRFERTMAVVSSDMAVTGRIPDLLERLGLRHGATVCDSRIFVHYYRTTTDGRLMLGKGGNTFAYGSRMIPAFFEPSRVEHLLRNALNGFFPDLAATPIQQTWNGGSDRTRTGFPIFGRLNNHADVFYGYGYSGNGVTQAVLGGRILASLCLGEDDEWSSCGFVGGPRGLFPPEPFRWVGANMVRNAIRRKEADEDAGRRPSRLDCRLARLAAAAGKADH